MTQLDLRRALLGVERPRLDAAGSGSLSRRAVLSAALVSMASTPGARAADKSPAAARIALVIGNGQYSQAPLRNAVNDAREVGGVLAAQGFTVLALTNATRAEMDSAVARTCESLRGRNAVGLLYFAGHGLQLEWRNYMLPVDAQIEKAADVPAQSIDVAEVLAGFKAAATRINIIVLDACRDSPFAGGGASGRGLAQMDAPAGSFLAYATAPGNVAEDGTATSGNGPYAQFLVQELKRVDARIEDVFKRVRFAVRRHTQGRQVPWESTSLDEDFSFSRGIVEPERIGESEREASFVRELEDWQKASAAGSLDEIYGYLLRYPSGLFTELARLRLEQLQRAAVQPVVRPGGVGTIDVARRRYKVGDVITWERHDRLTGTKQRMRRRVTSATDDRVEFNNGGFVLTQTDALVRNGTGEKSPPIVEVVADMAVGRRWRSAFTNTSSGVTYRNYYKSRVVALEELATAMGSIRCFRVEHSGESAFPDGRLQLLSRTTWVDASSGRVRRIDHEFRWAPSNIGRPGTVTSSGSQTVVAEEHAAR